MNAHQTRKEEWMSALGVVFFLFGLFFTGLFYWKLENVMAGLPAEQHRTEEQKNLLGLHAIMFWSGPVWLLGSGLLVVGKGPHELLFFLAFLMLIGSVLGLMAITD